MAGALQLAALKNVVPAARSSAARWGVPASVTLAQWICESGWGQSQLARRCRNYFGVKAVQGEDYAEFETREVVKGRTTVELAKFARYLSVDACFDAHGKLLATLPRYAPAMAVRGDILHFCMELYLCGYSTAQDYATKLMNLIHAHDLTQYDQPEPPDAVMAKEAA